MKFHSLLLALLMGAFALTSSTPVEAQSAYKLEHNARKALRQLYANNEKAREIGAQATAVLVFPSIVKAGFFVGGQSGNGVLFSMGEPVGYYNTSAVSYGLQFGGQTFGYVLFFMNHKALSYLNQSGGWEVGVGPSIVIVDTGAAKSLSSTTLQKDIYAFIFDQKGLMAGIGLQGSKITQYTPSDDDN